MAKLSPRQEKFIEEYLVDLNATQAAVRAGYSEKTAKAKASNLLGMPHIATAVAAAKAARSEKTGVAAARAPAGVGERLGGRLHRRLRAARRRGSWSSGLGPRRGRRCDCCRRAQRGRAQAATNRHIVMSVTGW